MSSTANVASGWGVPSRRIFGGATDTLRRVPSFGQTLTRGDRWLWFVAVAAIYLETVVYVEPAPVDAIIMFCLVVALLSGKIDFSRVGATALVCVNLFGLMCLVSMYEPMDMGRAVSYISTTLYLIVSWLVFVGLFGRYGKPLMVRLLNAYSITGLISALLGAGAYFKVIPFQDTLLLNGRARGLFKDCNVYGPFFVPIVLFAIVRLTDRRAAIGAKVWQALLLAAALLAILLSYSRGCWLNLGVAIAVFLAGQICLAPAAQRQRELLKNGLVLAVGVAAVTLVLNIPMIHEMTNSRVNAGHTQYYDGLRFATQDLAIETAKTRPLGIGPGQSEVVFQFSTHNLYLRVLSENGPLALLGLLGFMAANMLRCVTLMRSAVDPWIRGIALAVFASIAGHIANSFVIDTLHWRSVWFIYSLPWVSMPLYRYARGMRATNYIPFRVAQPVRL
jgi:O-antigen ligase